MKVVKKLLLILTILIYSLNCGCVSKVRRIVTALIKNPGAVMAGAEEYIPDNAAEYADPYRAPWPDPGFNTPDNYSTGHSGNTGTSYNGFNATLAIPQGDTPADLTGNGVNCQLVPSSNTVIRPMKDSYDEFNN